MQEELEKVYKCDHCQKKMFRKKSMEKHEKFCMTMTWQPIETAPITDYSPEPIRFLVFRDLGDRQYIKIESSDEWRYYELNNYTHWMPLPEKPTI